MSGEKIPVHLYRQIVSSVLALRKSSEDSATHEPLLQLIKDVFDYKKDRHESIIHRERKRTLSCDLSISIVEAKDSSLSAASQPYCVIRIENEPVPSSSPFLTRRRNSSISDSDNLLTQCVLSSKLVWDEDQRYKINVSDPSTQQLIIYILPAEHTVTPQSSSSYTPSPRGSVVSLLLDAQNTSPTSPEKSGGFRNFFDWFKSPDKKEKYRTVIIPLKEMSMKLPPKTDWYPITYKGRPDGSLKIQLKLYPNQRSYEESDLPECDENVSISDLKEVLRHFHLHSAKVEKAGDRRQYSGDLEGKHQQCFKIVKEFCSINNISDRDIWLINMGILLTWDRESQAPLPLSSDALTIASMKLTESPEVFSLILVDETGQESVQDNYSAEASIFLFDAARDFIKKTIHELVSTGSLVPPAAELVLPDNTFHAIRLIKSLWLWFNSSGSKLNLLEFWQSHISEELQACYAQWVRQEISEKFQETTNESLVAIVDFLEKIQHLIERPLVRVQTCFRASNIDYFTLMITGIDHQLPYFVKLLILDADNLLSQTSFESKEREFLCRQSMKLYLSLKTFVTFIDDNLKMPSGTTLVIHSYQSWFTNCLSFWLQMWQRKSHGYILNALRNDLKLQNVEGLRITEGAHLILDVLVSGICEEFKNLQLHSSEQLLIGTIKIAEIFCDAIVAYSNHTYKRLLSNEKDFSKRKIYYAVCSLDHLGKEAKMKLSSHLKVADLLSTLSADFPESVVRQSEATFDRLTLYAFKTAQSLAVSLTKLVVSKMEPRIRKIVEEIVSFDDHLSHKMQILMRLKQSPCQEYMYYLDKVLSSYFFAFGEPFKEVAAKDLKELTLKLLTEHLKTGMPPDYYEKMLYQIENLNNHFKAKGICYSSKEMKFQFFLYELRQNSKTTASLILEYFASLADGGDMTPGCFNDRGQLTIKAGYIRLTGEEVLIVVKVVRASNLSAMGKLGICSPFVRVEIAPFCVFPKSRWPFQTTKCANDRTNPEFDDEEKFEFTVPLTCFFTHGAVLGFSVWSFEFGTNELAGEVFIHLARLPEISAEQEVEWLPEQTYSLLQNRQTSQSSVFQIICDRMKWDPIAKKFIYQRKKIRRRMLRSRLLRMRSDANVTSCLPASCI